MRWSESDRYFVNGSLKVYSVDRSSEPLKLVPEENVKYDGPMGDDFKSLLLDYGFRVNRQGKAIIRIPKRNDEEDYNFFLLETVVPLGPYGFGVQSPPLPPADINSCEGWGWRGWWRFFSSGFTNLLSPTQEVKELKRLLEGQRQEVKELKSLMEETRADLVKKNAEVDELHRNWNSEQLRLTMDALTESMKKVFAGVDDLKPPAPAKSEYPMISVVGFLEKLRSLFLEKEFGDTFLVSANEILASIASTFYKRTGISIGGMETTMSNPSTPAVLIKNLSSLREFMGSRFFIDGSVIVKDFRLMNVKDIPVIFRDSEADVAELHRKEIGAKSMDNIEGKSIFYGYFNIPWVGKFKGILTRVDVTLPDEIMVKVELLRQLRPNVLDERRFWFVKANGEAIFVKALTPPESSITNINRVLGCKGLDFLGFLRRMNKTFVNKEGKYVKFDFSAIMLSGPTNLPCDTICYQDSKYVVCNPFGRVQFDTNEEPQVFLEGRVSLPAGISYSRDDYFEWILRNHVGMVCAFEVRGFCFIGKITKDAGADFRKKAVVSEFFEDNSQLGEDCYVDAVARTFFVSNPTKTKWFDNKNNVVPKLIG